MKIDRSLNLVIPLGDGGKARYVHSSPISVEVFEAHYAIIAKAFAGIYDSGLGITAGPRVAALILKTAAKQIGAESDYAALMNEVRRLTNVVTLDGGQWQTVPLHQAIEGKLLDPEEVSEVENAVAFFIIAWAMHKRDARRAILDGALRLWDGQLESSNCTEFTLSLKTSTPDASSGENNQAAASLQIF